MSKEQMKEKIVEYLKTHGKPTEDEIAKDLGFHVVDVLDVLLQLEKQGAVTKEEVEEVAVE